MHTPKYTFDHIANIAPPISSAQLIPTTQPDVCPGNKSCPHTRCYVIRGDMAEEPAATEESTAVVKEPAAVVKEPAAVLEEPTAAVHITE